MSPDKLFFYRSTKYPCESDTNCKYYNHSKGIVGCREPIPDKLLYFHGTMDELKVFADSPEGKIKRAGRPSIYSTLSR